MSNQRKQGVTKGISPKKQSSTEKPATSKQPLVINANCKGIELFTLRQCDMLMRLDAPDLTTDTTAFIQHNRYSYYLLINTWLYQVKDETGSAYLDLQQGLMRWGLVPVIKMCNDLALELITYSGEVFDYSQDMSSALADFNQPEYDNKLFLMNIVTSCTTLDRVLQLLRYPKRFCPAYADKIQKAGLETFISTNKHCKITNTELEKTCYIKKWAYALLPHISAMCKHYKPNSSMTSFSDGTASDADKPLGEKIRAYTAYSASFDDDGRFPCGSATLKEKDMQFWTCSVSAIPKSYKTPRIIAMESAYRQYHMQKIRRALELSIAKSPFAKMLNVRDQGPNRDMCREGSISGCYATIDLSSASDSLSRSFVQYCFPDNVWTDMTSYLAKYMQVPGSGNPMCVNMFSTSGSALTFIIESMVFLALCWECTLIAQPYFDEKLLSPRAYGDDMIVDNRIFHTVMDVLEGLRFTVNSDKSFGDTTVYRESCGAEYFNGIPVHTRYFPRATFNWHNGLPEALTSLTSLQHKLFSCRPAAIFLEQFILGIEPRMTSHAVGTDCADMWSVTPDFKYVFPPIRRDRPSLSRWDRILSTCKAQIGLARSIPKIYWKRVDLPENFRRESHLAPVSKYPVQKIGRDDHQVIKDLEMWRYRHFLIHGPIYEDALSELLHVTKAQLPLTELLSTAKCKWGYVKE